MRVVLTGFTGFIGRQLGSSCSDENVRLYAGHVEVCAHGTWDNICERQLYHEDARVSSLQPIQLETLLAIQNT